MNNALELREADALSALHSRLRTNRAINCDEPARYFFLPSTIEENICPLGTWTRGGYVRIVEDKVQIFAQHERAQERTAMMSFLHRVEFLLSGVFQFSVEKI